MNFLSSFIYWWVFANSFHLISRKILYRVHALHPHPSDTDAGWNSTQHPTSPRVLSEECDPAVNNWWMGLWCFSVSRYLGKPLERYIAEAHLLEWTNKWVFNASTNGLILCVNYFHPASPDHFHPASRRKIWLWYPTFGNIPRLHIAPIEVPIIVVIAD